MTEPAPISDAVLEACQRARRMVDSSSSRGDVLHLLVEAAENMAGPDAVASILVIDDNGVLRNGASPSLPEDYLEAIDRLRPDAKIGTCAAAAATGRVVITRSFLADDKWKELRHLPLALGFAGAWSMPIKSPTSGRVLGTFGTYYRESREPTPEEVAAVGALASAAAVALEST